MRLSRVIVVVAVLCSSAVVASAATGPATITTDQACYDSGAHAELSGSGFTSNGAVALEATGAGSTTVTADATGAFTDGLTVSATSKGLTTIDHGTVTATDQTDPTLTATTSFDVVKIAFTISGGSRAPHATRTWKFSGFIGGKPIYGHFRHHGKTYANYRFGTSKGPCGDLTVHAPGLPSKHTPAGAWQLQVDSHRSYSASTEPHIRSTFSIVAPVKKHH